MTRRPTISPRYTHNPAPMRGSWNLDAKPRPLQPMDEPRDPLAWFYGGVFVLGIGALGWMLWGLLP